MKIKLIPLMVMFLPNPLKIILLNMNPKNKVHPTAKIGFFTYLDAKSIHMGENSVLGHFNVCKDLENFHVGSKSAIRNFNTFKALPLNNPKHFSSELDRDPSFYLGSNSGISDSHLFDCCNSIHIGDFTGVAGYRSSFFTHGIDMNENKQISAPISIGRYCRIALGCVFTKGSKLSNYSVVGANSTIHKAFDEEYGLYSGTPAKLVKKLDPSLPYLNRTKGFVN